MYFVGQCLPLWLIRIFMKRILLLFILLSCTLSMSAQEKTVKLQGTVQDAFLKRGLFDCKVSLMRNDSVVVPSESKVYEMGSDSMHVSTIYFIDAPNCAGEYIVRVEKEGYDDGWAKVTIPEGCKDGEKIQVPLIEIQRSIRTIALAGVEVRATKIKVKTRGDTLVYDATAFDMPEGSMLEDLIEQLPGARMNDAGEIFINGRKVDELTLSSKSLFSGDKSVLLKNLPYFTVKELKVFERQSLQSFLSGTKDENPDYVMDVVLKKEYSYGLIANCDLAGGTHERYMGRLFGILLTKPLTVCAFANLNNINDSKRAGLDSGWNESQGHIMSNQNKPSVRKSSGVSIAYQSEEKVGFIFPVTYVSGDLYFDRYDNLNEAHVYNERFLSTGTAYGRTLDNVQNRITAWQYMGQFGYVPWGVSGRLLTLYKADCADGQTNITQWDSEQVTATQQTEMKNKTRLYGLSFLTVSFPFPIFKKLNCEIHTEWLRTESDGFNRQMSNAGMENEDYRHEYGELENTHFDFRTTLTYDQKLWRQLHLILTERNHVNREKGTDNLFVLSNLDGWGIQDSVVIDLVPSSKEMLWRAYDSINSSYSDLRQLENEFTPALKWNKGGRLPFDITLSLPLYVLNERLVFRRDMVDTLAHRTMFVLNPSLKLKHNDWSAQIGMSSSTPGLKNLMPYRDSRNPLSIVENNPLLKNNRRMDASMNWKHKLRKDEASTGESSGRLTSSFTYYLNSVAQGFTYNAQTGAYTYRPENVKGNWAWNTSYGFTLPLGNRQRWWIDSDTKADAWHSVDYASVNDIAEAQLNKVETVNLSEWIKLRYVGKSTKASLLGDVRWRRTWGHRPTQESISAFDYRYGVTVNHTLERWRTTFDADVCMYSRRGYVNAEMNKDECVVNVSVTQPILHGKVVLTLETHDLFNQISNTAYEVNAQGRTESWYRVTPNYIMLHAVYRFNINPKF